MLKRYRCHKVVEAGRIASIEQIQADGYQEPGWAVTLEGEGLARWLAPRMRPEVGGYFVRYEDGYTSYSPAAAFEAGYALEEMDGAIYPSKDPEPSVGPFRATVFSKPSGAPIESIADVVEVTAGSAQGGRPELFGVVIDEVDDRGLSRVVCYTGNGPRSEANARRIADLLTWDASNARPRRVVDDLPDDVIDLIARVCHAANREYALGVGEDPSVVYPQWLQAPAEIRESARIDVRAAVSGATPEQLHESWFETKRADGWIYGLTRDNRSKVHPCMVPYDQLPITQRLKDALFQAIVAALVG